MNKNIRVLWGYYLGIGFGIILVVAFFTSQMFMPLFFGRARSLRVPNVINMHLTKANGILIDNKLHGVVRDSTWSDEIQNGFVISQKPDPGDKIKPDGSVYLIISSGSKYVKVPNLLGMTVQSAWIVLRNNGLRISVTDSIYSDLYSINTVVQSSPSIGERVEKNSRIKLYISKGTGRTNDTLDVISDFEY